MPEKPKDVIKLEKVEAFGTLTPLFSISLTMITIAVLLTSALRFKNMLPQTLFIGSGVLSPIFMNILVIGLIVGHVPLAVKARRIVGELRRLNESLTIMADTLSVNLRTGLNFLEALRKTVPKITSPILRRRLLMLISYMDEGLDVTTALSKISYGLPERAINVLSILIPASESGGRAPQVVKVMAEFTRRLQSFERIKISAIKPYYYITLMALVVFEGATLFLLYLSYNFQQEGLGATGILTASIPVERAWILSFYGNLVVVMFSSLFVSKVVRGTIKFYADYLLVFLIVHLVLMGIAPVYMVFPAQLGLLQIGGLPTS